MSNPAFTRISTIRRILIPQIVMMLLSILWIYFFSKDLFSRVFNFSLQIICEGLLVGCGLALAGYGFYVFAKKTKKFYEAVELFEQVLSPVFKNLQLIDLFLLSLVAGLSEEIFFRGLLFSKVAIALSNVSVGIILSSLIFGAMHFPGKKYWIYAVWATASGALFAYLFYLTNSLWLPVTAHATNNLIGMILLNRMANKKPI